MTKNPRLIDLSGRRFGAWLVGSQAGNTKGGGALWSCACDCGEKRAVLGADLRNGRSLSCGHDKPERTKALRLTHGQTGSRLYLTWKNMRRRCRATRGKDFLNYASRGIRVCPEWHDFSAFEAWAISNDYADDLTIERNDVDGNYEPSNCCWIPYGDQAFNRRIVARAPDGTLWWHKAKANGITRAAYQQRVSAGWSFDQASSWPLGRKREPQPQGSGGRFVRRPRR